MIIQYLYDILSENINSIKRHKMRTLLSGIGIAWGMFILILLVGIGNGFRDGILGLFSDYASNSIWVTGGWTGKTSKNGTDAGMEVKLTDDVLTSLQKNLKDIKYITPEISLNKVSAIEYNGKRYNFRVSGVGADYGRIKRMKLSMGRLINAEDIHSRSRVVIIGNRVRHTLFKREPPIGEDIDIAGVSFQVIGVIDGNTFWGSIDDNSIFMPSETALRVFNIPNEYSRIGILMDETNEIDAGIDKKIKKIISKVLNLDANDEGALYINNVQLQVKSFEMLFGGIRKFLWFVGLCILLCGALGVSNVMLLATKERAKEFGIRKSIGATSKSILYLVLTESISITIIFGSVGITMGYLAILSYNYIINYLPDESKQILASGNVDAVFVIASFIILLICGGMAGAYPAYKAASVDPIHALNQEL